MLRVSEKVETVNFEVFCDAIMVGGDYAEHKPFLFIFMLWVEAHNCVMIGASDIPGRATVQINIGGSVKHYPYCSRSVRYSDATEIRTTADSNHV